MKSIASKGASVLGGLCILTSAAQAANGVLIVQRTTSGGTQTTNQVQIEPNRMRVETADPSGTKLTVVFDGAKQVMYLIKLDQKSYNEISKADVDRIAGQMQDMMAKMQAQMAGMPPEARAQIEAMMKGRGMGAMATPVQIEYRKTGTDRVGKWTCDKYEGYQNGQKASEICTVHPGALGLSESDFAVTRQFMDFFKKLIPQGAEQAFGLGQMEEQGFSGVPVKTTFSIGARTTTSEVTDVSRQTFPDSMFAVPAGFQKEDFMGGRGRGRQ